jgi:hypothetical protein
MASQRPPRTPDQVTWITPAVRPIATDLGSVPVLNEANRHRLTDPFRGVCADRCGWDGPA